jgi:hypothetical protein
LPRRPAALEARCAATAVCARSASLRKRSAFVVIRRGWRRRAATEMECASTPIVRDHLWRVASSVASLATAVVEKARPTVSVRMSRAERRSVAAVSVVALVVRALLILALVVIVLALRVLVLALLARTRLIACLVVGELVLGL